ncbi:MAG: superoxide dismutase [Proteobacteria bacterium]|nr:superoxide dismutase [Pseudomonadota bacterium]MBI3498606.1 superoxide dismutase [Pseudomonadota bacterium]
MRQPILPIACRPWMLNGLSERLIVSHYENNYGGAVRSLNSIRDELDRLDLAKTQGYLLRALKREELVAMGSVALHELYFGNLGGDGKLTQSIAPLLEEHFGAVDAWRQEFVAAAQAMRGGSGWVLLSYARRDRRLHIQVGFDHTQALVDALPILALDMYEHAYHMDFGANATAYIDAFMRNIDWKVVEDRLMDASGTAPPRPDPAAEAAPPIFVKGLSAGSDAAAIARLNLPSISIEELSAELAKGERRVQVLDARPKHYFSRNVDMMQGACWRDPNRVEEWSKELSADTPVFVYCAYGFHVGCSVTAALRERGFDAKYVRGGLSAWYAAGGERVLKAPEQSAIET